MKARTLLTLLVLTTGPSSAADPVRLTTDGSFKQHLQWSPDGNTLVMTRIHQGQMALWLMNADGSNLRRLLPNHRQPHFDGHWSPDGQRIVYVYDELQGTDGKLRIHTCKPDGSDDKTLVPHKAFEESPRFSPNGKRVLWVSTRDGNPELYTVTSDGKTIQRLTNEPAYDLHPSWSPDGKAIYFASGRSGKQKLYQMQADGTKAKPLTTGTALDAWPMPTPDGQRLVYVSQEPGNYDLFLLDLKSLRSINLTQHPSQDTSPAIHPSGKKIAFVSTRDGGSDVYVMDLPLALPSAEK